MSGKSFPKANRNLEKVKSEGPGPGDYNSQRSTDYLRNKSPKAQFGRDSRKSWIDEEVKKRNQSPGMIYEPRRNFVTKPIKH